MNKSGEDIKWATSFSVESEVSLELPLLDQFVEYIDHTGIVSDALGLARSREPRKFKGVSALVRVGKMMNSAGDNNSGSREHKDQVSVYYGKLRQLIKNAKSSPNQKISDLDLKWRTKTLKVYERYLGEDGFPLGIPAIKDFSIILDGADTGGKDKGMIRPLIQVFIKYYTTFSTETKEWLLSRIRGILTPFMSLDKPPASIRSWLLCAPMLFSSNGDELLAAKFVESPQQNITTFTADFEIPAHSELFSAIRLQALCKKISLVLVGESNEIFKEVEREKNESINNEWTVGAKALEIMINRCIKENQSTIPDNWADFIVDIGCHPDAKVSGSQHYRFWNWANSQQIQVATMAYVRRDLEVIFEYLSEQSSNYVDGHMVNPRIDFYKKLLRNNLIKDTRLFLGTKIHNKLKQKYGHNQFWDLHRAGDSDLCILALKLKDNINLTTGTKSFSMRFFPGDSEEFNEIWNDFSPSRNNPVFHREHFMIHENYCIRKPHQGDWVWSIIHEILPSSFLGRVDWSHYKL